MRTPRINPVFPLACIAALSLAGCNKPAAPKAPAAAATAPKAGVGMKIRKAGVWEVTTDMSGMPIALPPMRRCVGAEEVRGDMFRGPMGRRRGPDCAPKVEPQLDGSIRISGVCDLPNGGHSETSGVVSGDFTSRYSVTMTNTISGTDSPMDGAHTMKMEAKYLGPCPAGVEPGAMLDQDNKVMTHEDMISQFRARQAARAGAAKLGDGPPSNDND